MLSRASGSMGTTYPSAAIRTEHEGRIDPVGLTILHEPRDVPSADLVFIHNIGGGSMRSWSDETRRDSLWPLHWLSHEDGVESTRIHTYGYNSHLSASDPGLLLDIASYAKDLLTKLRFGLGSGDRSLDIGCAPLIFVGHSFGGLIAKKAYLLAQSNSSPAYRDIAEATCALVFFSTPHRNLTGDILSHIIKAGVPEWDTTRHGHVADAHVPILQVINDRFRELASSLDVYSFYPCSAGDASISASEFVLPRQLATLDLAAEQQIQLNTDLIHTVSFKSQADDDYECVQQVFRSLIGKHHVRRSLAPEDVGGQIRDVQQMLCGCDAPQDDLSFYSDKRISSSCEWILNQATMISFLENEDPLPHVLWCSGSPGCGKSVTATYMIESLLEEARPCAYYYFRSGNQMKNNLGQFFLSIAFQLSQHLPEYRRKLASLAAQRFDARKASHKLLWKKLFMSALTQCHLEEPAFVVLDGMDELGQVKDLLQKTLIELGDISIPLRLLLVSRPTLDIDISIERLSRRMLVQRLSLDNNADDLAMYVRDEMDSMMGEDDFKERTMTELLRKAHGNFLWAHLVVKEILECQTEGQVEMALQEVPKELEDLYERMDSRLADTFRSRPQDRRMGHTIMTWAACARRPLHLKEIQAALEHDFPRIMDMRQTIQRLCGEFILVDQKGHVSMMHASAREFLLSTRESNYYVDTREANHALLARCLQALTVSRLIVPEVGESALSLLEYAAVAWPYHLTQSSDHRDQEALTLITGLFESRAALDWMYLLVRARNLRAMVEASRALRKLLTIIDRLDRERNPLQHRLQDRENILLWSQDLIRVVGKFGPQITRHPKTVYSLVPPFCPRNSMLHKLLNRIRPNEDLSLTVRGNLTKDWGDCFAKFVVPGDALPYAIVDLDRYFAILTKDDGAIQLYYSATCEVARRLCHREVVTAFCVHSSKRKMATYSLKKTVVWDLESGRLLCSVESPFRTSALAIAFYQTAIGEEGLLAFFDDRSVRSCSFDSVHVVWEVQSRSLELESPSSQVNSPRNALFSPDGSHLAVSYRGAYPSVWYTGASQPRFVAQCTHRARKTPTRSHTGHSGVDVQSFAWNPLTGHLLGTWNDGLVFKWHPQDDDFALSDLRSQTIKCSTDGKLFATGSGDGTLRIWDFDHFAPTYQLRHPDRIQDLAFGGTDARVYDLREQFCSIWEPSTLLRAMENEDLADDAHSSRESEQHSLTSEAVQEDFEPVTAVGMKSRSSMYAFGDDAGRITISDFDGQVVASIEGSFMSIEKLIWSTDHNLLASADLGREIVVRELSNLNGQSDSWSLDTIQAFTETDAILQLLFSPSSDRILLSTPSAVKIQPLRSSELPTILPMTGPTEWCTHPGDSHFALGFTANTALLLPWSGAMDVLTLKLELAESREHLVSPPATLNPRRPSEGYPFSPSEIEHSVRKVLSASDGSLLMLEICGTTYQAQRRTEILLLHTKHLSRNNTSGVTPVRSITGTLATSLYVPLGFIHADLLDQSVRTRPSSQGRRSVSRRGVGLNTFAFIDTEFWVCSVDFDSSGREQELHKHFFLPRDWQNAEWLEMATVTQDGHLLCPRNGDVAVVSNGFLEELVLP